MKKHMTLFSLLFLFSCSKDDLNTNIQESVESLPTISIYTEDYSAINSRKDYQYGTCQIISANDYENINVNLQIKGRGNTSWNFPKKPYQISFDNKRNILGMAADKKWILLANYSDKTMLRNEVAFELSRLSNLDWTPDSRFVELILNDVYEGVYQITQKVEESDNRVRLSKEGYLLEVDQLFRLDPEDVYFETTNYLFNIKEPNVSVEDDKYELIKKYLQLTEEVLLGNNFLDPIEGYAKYIDIDSFVDWYLINEITRNNDAVFFSSVYMSYEPGKKLKMGPIWDYDISLGNINYNGNESTDGFWIKNTIWYTRLFEDPDFVAKVKNRFNYFYNNKNLIYEKINSNSCYVNEAQERNFNKWEILGIYVWPNYVYYDTYKEEVSYLETWLNERFDWLNVSINQL